MHLDTVERLTHNRDLAKRHIKFLAMERERLLSKAELAADEQFRLRELETRLSDCTLYLSEIEPQLAEAVPELSRRIRELDDENLSLILFERYVMLKPIRQIARELELNLTATYANHTQARDKYNLLFGIPIYKDPRGRRKALINS